MLDRADAGRPAQVNACFEGGTDQKAEILDALHQTGLGDDQITVIDRAMPEDFAIETAQQALANAGVNQQNRTAEIKERLKLYQQGKPFRDAGK